MRPTFLTLCACLLFLLASGQSSPNMTIVPGVLWLDNRGAHINAHGGGILSHNGRYYWYGEHKVGGELGNTAQVGVSCYSSDDLVNWENEGIALAVDNENPQSDIARGCVLERPKVIFNPLTGKFVMWFHLELKGHGYLEARSGVAVSDLPTGPYTFVKSFRPNAGFWPLNVHGRARVVPLRNTGAALSPFNAFQVLQGIETLALRVDRISDNTLAIARHLQKHPKVAWVNYAGLPEHADHALVKKYLSGKASGLMTFGLNSAAGGGREAGARFLDALQLFTRLVNIGDTKSLATHPASTTHRQLSPAELAKSGVGEDTVRLSVGIEHIDDLIADLDTALAAA